ncbi:MAG: PQQ-dependent dehydrogenase, methanol/ethanol family [Verrucomicrobia bacterium]|nr:PQQ-dependent dehydrogenase, methanol/ethanol family [Verrucomicrobiota bacterium]
MKSNVIRTPILFLLLSFAARIEAAQPSAAIQQAVKMIDSQRLRQAASHPSDWSAHGLNPQETRHSTLNQINVTNVAKLGLAWSRDLGTKRGIEATPLAIGGTLFFTTEWSVVHAVDAQTGQEIWQWDPKVDRALVGERACCDVVNRGVAAYQGRIYVGVLDGRLVALDAGTGGVAWEIWTVERNKNYTITGAPRIVDGKVIIGNGGAEYGVRGYVGAYDAETGKQVWRTYTVPGDPKFGFESEAMRKAAETWTGEWWKAGGGGTCWDSFAYDPELKLLYVGTGNGSPWNRKHRSPGGGDNLYLSSILALDPATGEIKWHFQSTPGDAWDYTATAHMILADLNIDGRPRKVIMQAPKNGFFWVIDRMDGSFISAKAYVETTWATGVDPKTGRPIEAEGARYEKGPALVMPTAQGAHNWHPMAFNPEAGLVYIPGRVSSYSLADDPNWSYREKGWNLGINFLAGRPENSGFLLAWDPVKQQEAWRQRYIGSLNGGVLSTAGGLVFEGTGDGRFVAYDAKTGSVLWEFPTGTGIIAPPVTYSVDGEQYVTVLAGWGGAEGLLSSPTGYAALYEQVGRAFTFKLGGRTPVPEYKRRAAPVASGWDVPFDDNPADVQAGEAAYHQSQCVRCHGGGAVIPDLRYSSKEILSKAQFSLIVYDGIYAAAKGMPSFKDRLTRKQVDQIRAFVVSKSREASGKR